MSTTDEFELRLRDGLADAATQVPLDLINRLEGRRYRTGRRRSLRSVGAVVAAAGLGIAAALTGSGGSAVPLVAGMQWQIVSDVHTPGWGVISTRLNDVASLACPTATTCYEEGVPLRHGNTGGSRSVISVTHDGGRTWAHWDGPVGIGLVGGDQDPACASATWCAAILSGTLKTNQSQRFYTTSDGGHAWSAPHRPMQLPDDYYLISMSCDAAGSCVAVEGEQIDQYLLGPHPAPTGPKALVTTDGWRTWRTIKLPAAFNPTDVQCFVDRHCLATGGRYFPGQVPAFNHETSQAEVQPDNLYSDDGGLAWKQAATPATKGPEADTSTRPDVSCATPLRCVELSPFLQRNIKTAPGVLATTDGGRTWTRIARLPGGIEGAGVSCSPSGPCWAGVLDDNPKKLQPYWDMNRLVIPGHVLYVSSDGGRDWTGSELPDHVHADPAQGWGLSCPTATVCYSLGLEPGGGLPLTGPVMGQQLVLLRTR